MTPEEAKIIVSAQPDPDDEGQMRVEWKVIRDSQTIALGQMNYDLETAHFVWHGHRPPAEYEGDVRLAIDRAIRKRTA